MSTSAADSDFSSMDTEKLIEKKRNSIDKMDFEEARRLEQMIQYSKKSQISQQLQKFCRRIEEKVRASYDRYCEECQCIRSESEENELHVRERIDQSFQELQKLHLDALLKIEKEWALAIVKAKNRPVPQKQQLDEQAKKLARMNDFDQSMLLREKGKEALDREMAERRQRIEDKFRAIRTTALEKQRHDMELLTKKLEAGLMAVRAELERQLQARKKRFLVEMRSLQQKEVVEAVGDEGKKKRKRSNEEKKILAHHVNKYVRDIVEQVTGLTISGTPLTQRPKRGSSKVSTNSSSASVVTPTKAHTVSENEIVSDEHSKQEEEMQHEISSANEIDSDDRPASSVSSRSGQENSIEQDGSAAEREMNYEEEHDNNGQNEQDWYEEDRQEEEAKEEEIEPEAHFEEEAKEEVEPEAHFEEEAKEEVEPEAHFEEEAKEEEIEPEAHFEEEVKEEEVELEAHFEEEAKEEEIEPEAHFEEEAENTEDPQISQETETTKDE